MEHSEILTIGFISIGGFTALLPLVIMGKLRSVAILQFIGFLLITAFGFGVFYTLISNYSFTEVMLLKGHPSGWPLRAISVPYIMIIAFVALLPVSIAKQLFEQGRSRPNKSLQATPKSGAPEL